MKTSNFSFLLVSTFLLSSAAWSQGANSDAYNWVDVPEDPGVRRVWREGAQERLTKRAQSRRFESHQAQTHWAMRMLRAGEGSSTYIQGHSFLQAMKLRKRSADLKARLFEGFPDDGPDFSEVTLSMRDSVPVSGVHVGLVREIEVVRLDIESIEAAIDCSTVAIGKEQDELSRAQATEAATAQGEQSRGESAEDDSTEEHGESTPEAIQRIIEGLEQNIRAEKEKLCEARARLQALQHEADSHAFTKYLSNINLLLAHKFFSKHHDSAVHPAAQPFIESVLQAATDEIFGEVDEVLNQRSRSWNSRLHAVLSPYVIYKDSVYARVDCIVSSVVSSLDGSINVAWGTALEERQFEFRSPADIYQQWGVGAKLQDRAQKWRGRISGGDDALTNQLALGAILSEGGGDIERLADVLSIRRVQASLSSDARPEGCWKRALGQMKLHYFELMRAQAEGTEGAPGAVDWFSTTYSFVQRAAQQGVEELNSEASTDKELWQAVTQMISYMCMHYVVTHNEKGQEKESPQSIHTSLGIESDASTENMATVAQMLASQAMQFYDFLDKNHDDFLMKTGLRAWLFAPDARAQYDANGKGEDE